MATFPPVFPIRNTPDTKMVDKFPCWQMEWCFPWKCRFSAIQPLTRKKSWENTPKISPNPPPKNISEKIISKSSKKLNPGTRKKKERGNKTFVFNISVFSRRKSAVNSALPYTLLKSSLPSPPKKKQPTKSYRVRFRKWRFPECFLFESSWDPTFFGSKKFGGSKIDHPFCGGFFLRFDSWFFQMDVLGSEEISNNLKPHLQVKTPNATPPKKTQESLKKSLKAPLFPAGLTAPEAPNNWDFSDQGNRSMVDTAVLFTGATTLLRKRKPRGKQNPKQKKHTRFLFKNKKLRGTGVFQKKQASYRILFLKKKVWSALKITKRTCFFSGFGDVHVAVVGGKTCGMLPCPPPKSGTNVLSQAGPLQVTRGYFIREWRLV